MVEIRGGFGFRTESRDCLRRCIRPGQDHFECDDAIERDLSRFENDAHATSSNLVKQFEIAEIADADGGRIARAIAWKLTGDRNRGTRFSARLGQVFSWVLIGLGVYVAVRADK